MTPNKAADRIEALDVSLLDDSEKLAVIDHWLRVLSWTNGWHYDLDIIWILREIEAMGLRPGATIMDAGGGLGVLQFILASKGFNVVSLDFTRRETPRAAKGIFNIISKQDTDLGAYDHEYMRFMTYGQGSGLGRLLDAGRWKRLLSDPKRLASAVRSRLAKAVNPALWLERLKDHRGFGTVTFLRGIFNAIPLPDASVDLVVSVSAFEHNTYKDMPGSVVEMLRVTRPGGAVLVTTSLAKDEDWYFEPPKGWNLTEASLAKWFSIANPAPIAYDEMLARIRSSRLLERRIDPYYRVSGENGLPFGILKDARYIPVGVKKLKP